MLNYSPNMLKTYLDCPKKFYFRYIENINVPASIQPFEKGKKIHALANYYLKGINISRIETVLDTEEENLWHLLKNNDYFSKTCLFSEFALAVKIDSFWVGGRIDAIVHDEKNYYILDYKTGSIPKNPVFDPQTMVYLLCADKYLEKYDSLSFVYIDLKNKKNHVLNFDDTLKTKYHKQITNICNDIQKDSIYSKSCTGCKYCEYSKICQSF